VGFGKADISTPAIQSGLSLYYPRVTKIAPLYFVFCGQGAKWEKRAVPEQTERTAAYSSHGQNEWKRAAKPHTRARKALLDPTVSGGDL
jgi:hypothetical protein